MSASETSLTSLTPDSYQPPSTTGAPLNMSHGMSWYNHTGTNRVEHAQPPVDRLKAMIANPEQRPAFSAYNANPNDGVGSEGEVNKGLILDTKGMARTLIPAENPEVLVTPQQVELLSALVQEVGQFYEGFIQLERAYIEKKKDNRYGRLQSFDLKLAQIRSIIAIWKDLNRLQYRLLRLNHVSLKQAFVGYDRQLGRPYSQPVINRREQAIAAGMQKSSADLPEVELKAQQHLKKIKEAVPMYLNYFVEFRKMLIEFADRYDNQADGIYINAISRISAGHSPLEINPQTGRKLVDDIDDISYYWKAVEEIDKISLVVQEAQAARII